MYRNILSNYMFESMGIGLYVLGCPFSLICVFQVMTSLASIYISIPLLMKLSRV